MALSSGALTTRAKAKRYLGFAEEDSRLRTPGIDVYHDKSSSATAATVEVTDTTIALVITGGANAGTDSLTLADAANDTLTELVGVINALAKGWVATLQGDTAAASGDLVTTQAVSAYGQDNEQALNYTANELLDRFIDSASVQIESWLHREFVSQDYSEILPFDYRTGLIELTHPLVTGIDFIGISHQNAMKVKYTGSDEVATVEVRNDSLVIRSRTVDSPTETILTFTNSSDDKITELVTNVAAVSGWAASTDNAGPSQYLDRRPTEDAKDREVTLESWVSYDDQYTIDEEAGTIQIMSIWGILGGFSIPPRVRIDYTAGFATVPFDVEQEALELTAHLFNRAKLDTNLSQERLGDYARTIKPDSAVRADLIARLSSYQRVSL